MATAKPGFASQQEVYNALIRQGASPDQAQILSAISRPESGGQTAATNHFQGHTYMGLFQIGEFWGVDPNRIRSDDIDYQAQQALRVLHQQGYQAWETYTNGSYRQYLGQNDITQNPDFQAALQQAQTLQFQRDPNYVPGNGSADPFSSGLLAAQQSPIDAPRGINGPGSGPSPIDAPGAPSPLGNPIDAPGGETIFGNPIDAPHGFDKSVTGV